MSVNEANPSELDLLRQRITELETENFDLKNENQKLRKELESRIEDHETRLAKVEQDSSVEQSQNERFKGQAYDVPNTVVDMADDAKLEQDPSVVDEQPQDAEDGKFFTLRGFKKGTSGDQSNNTNTKLTEDDPVNAFLIEQHKKSIGEEIRQRNREKKLQRESTVQETPSVSRERKNGQGLIQEMSSSAKE